MSNHPSRGWRARAQRMYALWASIQPQPPANAAGAILTLAEVATLQREAYLAGYAGGRHDAKPPRVALHDISAPNP